MPQAESFLSVSQKKQKQDCMLTGNFNMISKLSVKKISTLLTVFYCPIAGFHCQYSDRKVHAPEKNEHSLTN